MSKRYSIGAFSRRVQISVKALRFYEEVGLLMPASVDPDSGYRHYCEEQAALADKIMTLRATGMPVRVIAQVLAQQTPHDLRDVLESRLEDLRRDRIRVDHKIALVETLLAQSAAELPYKLVLTEPELILRRRVIPGEQETIATCFDELERAAAQAGVRAQRAPFCEVHRDGTWSVCVPVDDRVPDTLPAEFAVPTGIALSMTYQGSYSKTPEYLSEMTRWLDSTAFVALDPAREIYHCFGADEQGYMLPARVKATSQDRYVTELQLSIARREDDTR